MLLSEPLKWDHYCQRHCILTAPGAVCPVAFLLSRLYTQEGPIMETMAAVLIKNNPDGSQSCNMARAMREHRDYEESKPCRQLTLKI